LLFYFFYIFKEIDLKFQRCFLLCYFDIVWHMSWQDILQRENETRLPPPEIERANYIASKARVENTTSTWPESPKLLQAVFFTNIWRYVLTLETKLDFPQALSVNFILCVILSKDKGGVSILYSIRREKTKSLLL
jgi:hypothetical protein